jgi:hypothetical protein
MRHPKNGHITFVRNVEHAAIGGCVAKRRRIVRFSGRSGKSHREAAISAAAALTSKRFGP